MTSTEFKIGLDGNRVSSKVLKPPGGGSSDIFGRGTPQVASNGYANERVKNESSSTQNRLFGSTHEPSPAPVRSQVKSNIFETNNVTKSAQKRYVHRNPITGEVIEYNPENYQKNESNGKQETEGDDEADKEQNNEEEKKTDIPVKPIQTSIRVRNPPGGKSSGIF